MARYAGFPILDVQFFNVPDDVRDRITAACQRADVPLIAVLASGLDVYLVVVDIPIQANVVYPALAINSEMSEDKIRDFIRDFDEEQHRANRP